MNDPIFQFAIEDWWITLYIRNTVDFYLHTWVPLSLIGLVVLTAVVQKIKGSRKKQKPLLGVVPPRG